MLQGEPDQPNVIFEVDPGHPLAPGSQRAADSQAKWREHLFQRAASGAQYDAGTQPYDADP